MTAYKTAQMPNQRKDDQAADAFSAPRALLDAARQLAAKRQWTKSGLYRYVLAKELGYPESAALDFVMHGQVRNSINSALGAESVPSGKYPASSSSPYVMNDKPVTPKRRKKKE